MFHYQKINHVSFSTISKKVIFGHIYITYILYDRPTLLTHLILLYSDVTDHELHPFML